jgi:hypothetical protein
MNQLIPRRGFRQSIETSLTLGIKVHTLASLSIMGKDKDKRKSVKGGEEGIGEVQAGNNFLIAPSEAVTKLDTSKWPLLLKVRFPGLQMSHSENLQ